ncbi:MAG: DUF2017 family protein [Acidimicrobiaceae bacterium]|nr:DUF2017 family protein [Acidimicrobiaceae bacterium]
MPGARFRPGRDGIRVTLRDDERAGLAAILEQFRQLLLGGRDPSLLRFQPPVHIHDREASEEFWEMAGDSLLRHRLEAIDTVEAGLDGAPLDGEGVEAWMQTLNSVRLYLGNTLEVGAATFNPPREDDQPREAARYVLYEWLGGLLDQLVTVAAGTLPPGMDD